MIRANSDIEDSSPEILIVFDCRRPGAKNRLHRERRAWGAATTVENLGYGRAVLVVRPGVPNTGGTKLRHSEEVSDVER
jgi:hypothetical protein